MKKFMSVMSQKTKIKCAGIIILAFVSFLLASLWPVRLAELYTNISNGTILCNLPKNLTKRYGHSI